ncbi:MAG: PaaI family thioesterase [Pirellulaceae bacterium]|nr:PaaI family thioesterase [Pirellulaceae bacterium]
MTTDTDRFSTAPISQLVGFDVVPADPAAADAWRATVRMECSERYHNPMGRVHGGVIAALADASMGIAFGRTLLESEDFSTIEMKVNFMRPIRDGLLVANSTVVDRGLRIGFVRCEILNARGKRVATATCTCTVIASEETLP